MDSLKSFDEIVKDIPDDVLNRIVEFEGTTSTIKEVIKENVINQEMVDVDMEIINALTSLKLNEERYIGFLYFKRIK